MSRSAIVPSLWFDDQAEEAAHFYAQAFGEGRVTRVTRYSKNKDNPSGKPRGSVLTVEFELAGQRMIGINGGPYFKANPSISFFAHVEFGNDAERVFNALAIGGEELMPLDEYPWSERYGWIQDRYGVSWQVMTGPRERGAARIVPCMMFSGAQHRRAEEAMRFYTEVFPEGKILDISRYGAGEGPEGTVKHGRYSIAGQEMVAMDSHLEQKTTFNEAISLQVECESQAEIDRYWSKLCAGGEEGRCGWLEDRFGVSWQVVPAKTGEWMVSEDEAARDRAFEAMLAMNKLDLAQIQAAFDGR